MKNIVKLKLLYVNMTLTLHYALIVLCLSSASTYAQSENETYERYNTGEYRSSRLKEFDLIHTKLEVSFDWTKQYLLGKADLKLTPHFFPQDQLILDAKGMDIHRLLCSKNGNYIETDYTNTTSQLIIQLPYTLTMGDTIDLSISYTCLLYTSPSPRDS